MLHFRSPTAETDLAPMFDLNAGAMAGMWAVAKPDFATSGIAPAALVETARGTVLARDIRSGDRVVTRDGGLQPVRWVGTSSVIYDEEKGDAMPAEHRGPVRVRAGALGSNPDAGNLVLAPGQHVLVRNPLNTVLFATDEVMAAIGDLTHLDGVDVVPRPVGRWIHILLDNHALIRANGLWMGSFAPDMWSIRVAYPDDWHAITEAMPRLCYVGTQASYIDTRPNLDAREARLIDAI